MYQMLLSLFFISDNVDFLSSANTTKRKIKMIVAEEM